jgi:hypothetical protein
VRCVCEAERGWGQEMGIADFSRLLEGAGRRGQQQRRAERHSSRLYLHQRKTGWLARKHHNSGGRGVELGKAGLL